MAESNFSWSGGNGAAGPDPEITFTNVRILDATGLASHFATVQGGDGPRKPAPDQLHIACAELSAVPATSWMVGDHHTDLLAGRAAGCRTAHCAWGIGHSDGVEHDLRLEVPGDLLPALGVSQP